MQRASIVGNSRRVSSYLLALSLLLAATVSAANAQDTGETAPPAVAPADTAASSVPDDGKLRFSFSGASWKDVFEWIAEAGDLSLYVDDVPTGTFSYSDSDYFSVDQAITRLNLFLLPRGYTLVRRGQLLSVINLGDPRGLQQLDAMATVVSKDDLQGMNDHEVVKCFVPLGELIPTEVINEMQPLKLITTPVVLPKSNQLIITDSVKNLRSALSLLESMQQPDEEEQVVKRFDLKHVDADTVLMVAGTHLGIPTGESNGLDITITTDITGKRMFAVGSEEKLKRLESLLEVVDVPDDSQEKAVEQTLISHHVSGDNLQIVYDVLQTMLADKSLRLTMQPESNAIVALAEDDVHQLIRDTIEELQAPSVEFAVVDLKSVDPYFAVSLIAEMFEINETQDDNRRWRDRDEEEGVKPPKVDADPGNRRLFVRGTSDQIEQIEQLVARLEARGTSSESGKDLRFVPLTGPTRDELLQTAKRYWQGENCLQILPPSDSVQSSVIERTVFPEATSPAEEQLEETHADVPSLEESKPVRKNAKEPIADDFVALTGGIAPGESTFTAREKAMAPIRSQLVPNGILIQSEDIEALDRFEEHLREISSQDRKTISPTVVYYLKYVTAEEAVKMLADLLDGGSVLSEPSSDTLVSGSGGYSSDYYGSFLFERDGVTTVTAGTATVVSDARLNRLIVQGTKEDIATIEGYMKIIDKDSSITEIETAGRSRVIELQHARAEEVAEMIREAFPSRVDTSRQRAAQQQQQQQRGGDDRRGDDNNQRSVDDNPTRGSKPTMAVAVHEASNSLVITAPDALFAEVQKLVDTVDRRSERSVRVISAGPGVTMETISQILEEQNGRSSSRDRGSSRSSWRDR